jgi:hypothetical protein
MWQREQNTWSNAVLNAGAVLLMLVPAATADPPLIVTQIETTAQGEGTGSISEELLFTPPKPVAEYSDSLHAEITSVLGTRSIDASFAITLGTTFTADVVCAEPDPPTEGNITAYAAIDLVVLSDTTVEIVCTSEAGATESEWHIGGPVNTTIHGAYDGSIEFPVGTYYLDALLDWGSTTPHTLTITSQDADVLRIGMLDCDIELHATTSIDISDVIYDPAGIDTGSSVSSEGMLPDCFVEYTFESSLSWEDDIGSPISAPGFIATGRADRSDCALGSAGFAATFTIEVPHYAIWQSNTYYYEDSPEIDSTVLCPFDVGYGCTELAAGTWQLTDGGIYDGSNVQLSLGFLPAKIRVPEDVATIAEGITLASQRAVLIQSLEPFCNDPGSLSFTIEIAPGTYTGPISLDGPGVDISITTRDGPGTVDLVGLSSTRCLDLSTGYTTVQIDGLTFSGGASDIGGGVRVGEGISVQFTNCAFNTNSASDSGGAVHVASTTTTSVTFDTCTFDDNDAVNDGGGVLVSGAVDPTFSTCSFSGNNAGTIGGALCWLPSNDEEALVNECSIQMNSAILDGAGIAHVESGDSSLSIGMSVICKNVPINISGSWEDLGGNTICMPCPADLNDDGVVSGPDLTILLSWWGPCPPSGKCLGDINEDGIVSGSDLSILLGLWGKCP